MSVDRWVAIGTLIAAPLMLVALWAADLIRPGSLARAGPRKVSGHPFWVWLLSGGLVFLCWQLGGAAANIALMPKGIVGAVYTPGLRVTAIVQAAACGAGIVAAAFILNLLRARADGGTGLSLRPRDAAWGVVAMIAAYPIISTVGQAAAYAYAWQTSRQPEQVAHDTLAMIVDDRANPWAWVLIAVAVIGAPVIEEMIYRVGLQSSLLRLTGRPGLSVCLASLVFASMHYTVMPIFGLPAIFVVGLSLGIAYERSKGLLTPIVMHAIFNAINVWLAFVISK